MTETPPPDEMLEAAAGFEQEEKTSPEVVRAVRPPRSFDDHNPTAVVALADANRRRVLAELLTSDGWSAVEAEDTEELLEQCRLLAPHVVFIESDMQGREGEGVANEVHQERSDVALRVVALLPNARSETIATALADGFDDFVTDPSNGIEVLARATSNLRAARNTGELHKQQRDAALLLEMSQTLASSLDMQLILHTVSRLIADVAAFERCSIVLVDPDHEDAVMVAASEDRTVKDLRIKLPNYPELKRCVETAAPVMIDDATSDPLLLQVQRSVLEKNVRTMALFPIVFEERVTGVLFLRSSKPARRLSDTEMQFGQTVASACAVAIRNARLFDQFRDQTERINSMRMLAERQTSALKKYQDFFEYAADGMAIIDGLGRILYVNKEGRRLVGRTRDELLQLTFLDLLLEESRGRWQDVVDQVRHGRFKRSFDVFVGRGDGNERVFSLSAGGGGQETGLIIVSFRDVTETREMEGELRTTKEFLENLIDNSVDGIVAADMNGNIMLFNKGAERIYGYRAEDVIGRMHVSQLYPQGVAAEVMKKLRDDRWGGRGRLEAQRRDIVTFTGVVVPVSMTASIIYEDGEEVATVGVFTDLRERISFERQLNEAKVLLSKTEKARVAAELAGMAAHELNQPLTSVLGYADMLKNRVAEGDALRRHIDTIFLQAGRMAEIVRKIGSITKYETKRYGLNTDMIDLNAATSLEHDAQASFPLAEVTPAQGQAPAPGDSQPPMSPEDAVTTPPRTQNDPTTAAKRSSSGVDALRALSGPIPRHPVAAGRDPRSAVVRMDTVEEHAGYAGRRKDGATRTPSSPTPRDRVGAEDDHQASAALLRTDTPPAIMRPVALNPSSDFDDESGDHTNPGVRLSDLKRR
jgi:PAS domain S-box-containing protein